VTITNPSGQSVERLLNVGWDSYLALLPGGGQTELGHTFPGDQIIMFSLPAQPLQTDAPAVLGIPANEMLMARWDPTRPGNGAYQIWPMIDPFEPGRAYWIKFPQETVVDIDGLLPATNQDYEVPVPLGWSQIGSPRLFSVDLASVRIEVGTTSLSFTQAVDQGYLQEGLYHFLPGLGYEMATSLEPYEGYWIRCLVPGGVRLVFPAQ
jgi:hypothetical protein